MFILSISRHTANQLSEISLNRVRLWKNMYPTTLSGGKWSRFVYWKQGIVPNTIYPHFHSPKYTHQGKLRTKNWSDFLHLRQKDTIHLCTQDGNYNKGCFIPPDTYLGIIFVPDFPGCLVIWVTPHWTHTLWYGDLNLSGAYICFYH